MSRKTPGLTNPSGPVDKYQIQIIVDCRFPKFAPVVFETGERLPRDPNRHVNDNGSCCICVWEVWLITSIDQSFRGFLNGPLHQYFLSQTVFEETGKWPFGEEAHYGEGIIEAFAEIMDVQKSGRVVLRYLNALKREWPKGHLHCPCGSKKILRKCCRDKLWHLHQKIPPEIAGQAFQNLLNSLVT